jgi:hypothetical protein
LAAIFQAQKQGRSHSYIKQHSHHQTARTKGDLKMNSRHEFLKALLTQIEQIQTSLNTMCEIVKREIKNANQKKQ